MDFYNLTSGNPVFWVVPVSVWLLRHALTHLRLLVLKRLGPQKVSKKSEARGDFLEN